MKTIPVSGGRYFALVDDRDFEELSKHKWHALKSGKTVYAQRRISAHERATYPGLTTISMHKQITGYEMTDHRDGDGLNNQRSNLRWANKSINGLNRPGWAFGGYTGVGWHKEKQAWSARCVRSMEIDGPHPTGLRNPKLHLGYFRDKEEAARVRDNACRVRHGEVCVYNIPRPGERSAVTGDVSPGDATILTWGREFLAENPGVEWGCPKPPPPPGMRWCSGPDCRAFRPLSAFGPNGRRLQNWCRDCRREDSRKRYVPHPRVPAPRTPGVKPCTGRGCEGKEKPPEEFGPSAKAADGLHSWCRSCQAEAARERRLRKKRMAASE